jgi:hypothetical protein
MANNNLYKTIGQLSVFKFSSEHFLLSSTHVKSLHLVASLSTGCKQVVLPLVVPTWNNLTTCNIVDIIGFVCCKVVPTSPIQSWYNNIVNLVTFFLCQDCISDLLQQPCNKPDNAIKLACSKLLTACSKLVTTTGNKECEHNLSTTCEQISSNLFADLQELVRFYVCTVSSGSIFY